MKNHGHKKILFVGDLNEYGRSFQRFKTLKKLGYEVDGVSYVPISSRAGFVAAGFFERIFHKLGFPLDKTGANRQIRQMVIKNAYDVVWIEKGNSIRPHTLYYVKKYSPETKLISLSEDDMYAKHNRSIYYSLGLKYYDVVFTTKTYNLDELKLLGAKRTKLFLDAFDEYLHRPLELSPEDRRMFGADVGFIGTFEEDRAKHMLFLAEYGILVVIWGNGWEKWAHMHKNLIIKNQPLYGENYVKAINSTKINLCFLRKMNRDEVTSRSVEIPACGAFMLGERTRRHLEFFEEGKEAEFFGDKEEMLKKTSFYLNNEADRIRIAQAGRERCESSGYSHRNQLRNILNSI